MRVQTEDLVLLAVGLGAQLQDDPLPNGYHLRWFTSGAVGFPHYGFRVSRRPAQRNYTEDWHPGTIGGVIDVQPPAVVGEPTTISLSTVGHAVTIDLSPTAGPVTVRAFATTTTAEPVAMEVVASPGTIELVADAIRTVTLEGGATVHAVEAAPVTTAGAWTPVAAGGDPVVLLPFGRDPVGEDQYPARIGAAAAAKSDWGVGDARLLPADRPGWRGVPFDELHDWLALLLADGIRRGWGHRPEALAEVRRSLTGTGTAPPAMHTSVWELLSAASIDPGLARLVGLAVFHDDRQAGPWDYMVEGTWGFPADTPTPIGYDVDNQPVGAVVPTLTDGYLRIDVRRPAVVEARGWPQVSRQSLRASGAKIEVLQQPQMVAAWVGGPVRQSAVMEAYYRGTLVDRDEARPRVRQPGVRLVVTAPHMDTIVLQGIDRIYRVGRVNESQRAHVAAIAHNVGLHAPPLPSPPHPVEATAIAGATQGAADLRTGVAVEWPLPNDRPPSRALAFHVRRYDLGTGAQPAAPTPGKAVLLTGDGPVLPDAARGIGALLDVPVADGWYAYEVAGVDAFGRIGGWGRSDAVDAFAVVPPPPPFAVDAFLLDDDDPALDPGMRPAVLGAATGDVLVRWRWTAALAAQCPDATEFNIRLSESVPNVVDGSVTGVAVQGGVRRCTTDVELKIPDQLIAHDVRLGGVSFCATGNGTGKGSWIDLEPIDDPGGPAVEPRPGRFSITLQDTALGRADVDDPATWGGSRASVKVVPGQVDYSLVLPGPFLAVDRTRPIRTGSVIVTAVKRSAGGRPPLESRPSTELRIVRALRVPPDEPTNAPVATSVYASYPDYWGRSHYEVRWATGDPDRSVRYEVYRATDESLFAIDRKLRASGMRQGGRPDYAALTEKALRTLAGEPGSELAFTRVSGALTQPSTPEMAFVDRFDGRATNRLFWRIGTVDELGNRKTLMFGTDVSPALSPALGPILMRDVTPPRPPAWVGVLAKDGAIELQWALPIDSDTDEFQVFRSADADGLADLRGQVPRWHGRAMSLLDPADPATRWYYRLVAVDTAGNVSSPSPIVAGRALDLHLPAAVDDLTVKRGNGRVEVSWTHAEPDARFLVQWRGVGPPWVAPSGWLPPGTTRAGFDDPDASVDLTIRVGVTDARGAPSADPPASLVVAAVGP